MASEATGLQENEDRDGGSIGNEQGTVSSKELSYIHTYIHFISTRIVRVALLS